MNYKHRIAYLGQSKQRRYGEWEFRPSKFSAVNSSRYNHVRNSLEIDSFGKTTTSKDMMSGLDFYFNQKYNALFYYNERMVSQAIVEKCLAYLTKYYEHNYRPSKTKEVKLSELDQT